MSKVHAAQDAPRTNSAPSGRKLRRLTFPRSPRTQPPAACCTSAAVRDHGLFAAMEIAAVTQSELPRLEAVYAVTTDGAARQNLRDLTSAAWQRLDALRALAAFLDRSAAALEGAEERRDYDHLADLASCTGKDIAAHLRPLLDVIRDPFRLGEIPAAQAKLHPWFEQVGRRVLASDVAYTIGKKRTPTLVAEFARWERFGRGESADGQDGLA